MAKFIIQLVLWTLCAVALWVSYWNYSRYLEAKQDREQSKRNLQTALYVRNDCSIGDTEFERIASSHYRPYQRSYRVALLLGLTCGVVSMTLLLA
jgi:hypothetical protein